MFVCGSASDVNAQPFTFDNIVHPLPNLTHGTVSFVDINRDGGFDIIAGGLPGVTWRRPDHFLYAGIFQDNSAGGTLEYTVSPFPASGWNTRQAWRDFNNDGWPDVAVSGITRRSMPYEPVTILYRGGPNGFETAQILSSLRSGSVAWADFDNDGDEDLLITGIDVEESYHTRLYENVDGVLKEVAIALPGIAYGDAEWGDFDNDQDKDLFLTGALEDGAYFSRIYRNDDGTLVPLNLGFEQLHFSSAAWGDFEADGDLDLAINGARLGLHYYEGHTYIYRNDGDSFTPYESFPGTYFGDVGWGDYDNSGTLDLVISGSRRDDVIAVAKVFSNINGSFEHRATLPGVNASSFDLGDADSDGDLDLVLAGKGLDGGAVTAIYQNTGEVVNKPPSSPTGLQISIDDSAMVMSWEPSNDSLTASEGLSYAVRLGTSPRSIDVVAPMADLETGRRQLSVLGNAGYNTKWRIRHLREGTYYWSVQAIDGSFVGSEFSKEVVFTLSHEDTGTSVKDKKGPTTFALHSPRPNPSRSSITVEYSVPTPTDLSIVIYDVLGRKISRLEEGRHATGTYSTTWHPENVGAGVYICRMTTRSGWSHVVSLTVL